MNSDIVSTLNPSIRLVVQRYRKASLLIDEKDVVTFGSFGSSSKDGNISVGPFASSLIGKSETATSITNGHVGMLVYVSFAKTATVQDVSKAARTILNLPIQTEGAWGDGSTTKSVLQIAAEGTKKRHDSSTGSKSSCSIMLVPQANIIAKVKRNGKSVQYRDQIDKENGEKLYQLFRQSVEGFLIDEQWKHQGCPGGKDGTDAVANNNKVGAAVDASVLPKDYFSCLQAQQGEPLYGNFDPTTGIPQTNANGTPLTKSATKRIRKLLDAHIKRHEKYLSKQKQQEGNKQAEAQPEQQQDQNRSESKSNQDSVSHKDRLDPSFVQLVAGSFGKRQGIEIFSDMGPFCHVIEI